MKKFIGITTSLFPLWVLIFSFWAFIEPEIWSRMDYLIVPLLSLVMFSMGLTLKTKDFFQIFEKFKVVGLGIILQFLLMPLLGFLLVTIFGIEKILALGVILVGCSPGGTASNVVCYLAKGNVALSISLTICSTFLAVLVVLSFKSHLFTKIMIPFLFLSAI